MITDVIQNYSNGVLISMP